ncbi:MAG: Gfo/Idh/MocA family oxidoreductase [Balneolales bacterium]
MKISRRKFVSNTMLATAGTITLGFPKAEAATLNPAGANERIHIGLIGCGGYGRYLMGLMLNQYEYLNIRFIAVCDVWKPQMDIASERIREATGVTPFQSTRYQDVLDHPDVDAVVIASPDFAHSRQLVDAAKAGKHIWVEKCMATRMADANAALDAIREYGVVCQVGTQRRGDRRNIATARFMRENRPLGQIINADINININNERWQRDVDDVRREDVDWEAFLMYLPNRPYNPHMLRAWRLYKDCSFGSIGLLGTHSIDATTWLCDDSLPERVVGFGSHMLWKDRRETMDYQHCIFSYPKGWVLNFHSRFQNSYFDGHNFIYGTNGTFDTQSWVFRGEGGGENRLEQPIEAPVAEGLSEDSRDNMFLNWVTCIREGGKTYADIYAGYAHSVAAIMGFQSLLTGQPVVFDSRKRAIRVE